MITLVIEFEGVLGFKSALMAFSGEAYQRNGSLPHERLGFAAA